MRLARLAACALMLAGCSGSTHPSAPPGVHTEVLALRAGQVVGGVPCVTEDLPEHHIHVHLQILLDGMPVPVPAGIGVGRPWSADGTGFITAGRCFARIHTHDPTGIVHLVTPEEKPLTLGQLFEVWGQPLARDGALGYEGRVAALVNGAGVPGDPRSIPLNNFDNVVLELGRSPSTPAPRLFDFASVRS